MKSLIGLILIGLMGWHYFQPNTTAEEKLQEIWASAKQMQEKLQDLQAEKKLPRPPKLYRPKQFISKKLVQHISINNNQEKDLADLIQACDFDDPLVRNTAVKIAGKSAGSFNLGQVCNIYDLCKDEWNYVNDPSIGSDYVAKASETLKNGMNGDCDDFSILIYSLITAIGGEARITYAYDNDSGHAFTEVRISPDNQETIKAYLQERYDASRIRGIRSDRDGIYWLNLDWFDDFPGGKYYDWERGYTFNLHSGTIEAL